jgi:hypothetical protein
LPHPVPNPLSLLDEPLGALDLLREHKIELALQADFGTTFVCTTSRKRLCSDRVAVMMQALEQVIFRNSSTTIPNAVRRRVRRCDNASWQVTNAEGDAVEVTPGGLRFRARRERGGRAMLPWRSFARVDRAGP